MAVTAPTSPTAVPLTSDDHYLDADEIIEGPAQNPARSTNRKMIACIVGSVALAAVAAVVVALSVTASETHDSSTTNAQGGKLPTTQSIDYNAALTKTSLDADPEEV